MPSVSAAQHRFFGWARSHPEESGVKPQVSQEFLDADKGRSFGPAKPKAAKKPKKTGNRLLDLASQ